MLDTVPAVTAERLRLHQLQTVDLRAAFAADVARGLQAQPKQLCPKYFYDELGSLLFAAICLLPEYYVTRAEDEILTRHAAEIVAATGHMQLSLLELGSGSATKTRRLIEALLARQPQLLYRPIDISAAALETSARVLLQSYPSLRVEAYASDYDTALVYLRSEAEQERASATNNQRDNGSARTHTLALFLGSNVGNFDRAEAEQFLRSLRGVLRAGDALLLGADLKKDPARLVAAYDDALGVTAAFNLNLLARLNREFNADFDPRAFQHVARYDEAHGRIELYLASRRAQVVRLPALDLKIDFAAGERLHTENSHKYDLAELDQMAARTGFARTRTWMDEAQQFSSNLFIAAESEA